MSDDLRAKAIRLAHSLPKGSENRKALLEVLKEARVPVNPGKTDYRRDPTAADAGKAATDYLSGHRSKAVAAVRELFRQAEAGYGAGNAVGEVAKVLKEAIPSRHIGFLPDALKKAH